jgi:hypothetical protein
VEDIVRITGAVAGATEEADGFVATSGAVVQAVNKMINDIQYEYFICSPYDAGDSHFGKYLSEIDAKISDCRIHIP